MEIEIQDVHYDTGYGVHGGDLVIEFDPVIEDCTFSAHGLDGTLRNFGDSAACIGVKNIDATLFLIGNNGQEIGEYHFDTIEDLTKHFNIDENYLIEEYQNGI